MRNCVAPFVIALMHICAAATGAAAQQNPVEDYWAALEAVGSAAELSRVAVPAQLVDPLPESLRLIREYELNPSNRTAYRARWDLQRALERNPNSAAHHLAIALLLRRGPDANVRLDDDAGFIDPRSNASRQTLRSLRRALELDPELGLAALELGRFAQERHEEELLDEAARALARVEQSEEVILMRAALATERGDVSAALQHATAASFAGADRSRVAHARAAALLSDRATAEMGAAAYLDGLRNVSEVGLQEYYASTAMTLTPAEEAAWRSLPAERRAGWLRELWEMRAGLNGVSLAERLHIHYRRLHDAYRDYPLYAPMRRAAMQASMGVLLGEDPRRHKLAAPGLMLVRFGDPAWLRWLGVCGGNIPYLQADSMSMSKPLDEFVPPGATRLVDEFDIMQHEDAERLRNLNCSNATAVRQFAQWLVSGERYRPHFAQRLNVLAEFYAFRAAGGGTEVVAAVSLPTSDVTALAANGRLTLNSALAVVDTAGRRTSRIEQPVQLTMPDAGASHLLLALPVATPLSGAVEMRLTLEHASRSHGSVVGAAVDIPDFASPGLRLSDVVIAPQPSSPRLRRGDVGLSIAAGRIFSPGETFDLYYEIYGIEEDAAYRTKIVIAPHTSALWRALQRLTGSEPDVVTLEFEERAGDVHEVYGVQQMRSIGTGTLRPGTYRLRVVITNLQTGAESYRERLFDVGS